jgi:hypothetical protein
MGLNNWQKQRLRCDGKQGCSQFEWPEPVHDIRDCLHKFIATSQYALERQRRTAVWRQYQQRWSPESAISMDDLRHLHEWDAPVELNDIEIQNKQALETIIQISQGKLMEIDRGAVFANEKREDCRLALDAISKRLTCRVDEANADFDQKYIQSSDPEKFVPDYWNPTQKYLLRGVATTNEITYICVREEADLIELEESPVTRDQWWKLQFAAGEANSVKVEVSHAKTHCSVQSDTDSHRLGNGH